MARGREGVYCQTGDLGVGIVAVVVINMVAVGSGFGFSRVLT